MQLVAYLEIHSLFRLNGQYCHAATHADTGIRLKENLIGSLPTYTLTLPSHRSFPRDSNARYDGSNGTTQILCVAYPAIPSLVRVNNHYSQTATHAETGIRLNANSFGNLLSDTLAFPGQRSLLSDSNARSYGNTAESKLYRYPA